MNKFYKKTLSIILAIVLAIGTVASLPERAQASMAVTAAISISKVGLGLLDRAVVAGLDYAADQTGNNMFTTTANLVGNLPIIGDNTRNVSNQCKEIIKKLDDLSDNVYLMNTEIQQTLAEISVSMDKNELSKAHSNISRIAADCNKISTEYKNYLNAVDAYAELVGEYNKSQTAEAKAAMDRQETRVEASLNLFVKTAQKCDFSSAIMTIAQNACLYYPAFGATFLTQTGVQTNLYYAAKLSDESFAFEHQKYEFVSEEMNVAAAAFASVSIAHRIWADYLESENKLTATEALLLEETQYETTQGINDLMAQADKYVGGLMRSYDVDKSMELEYRDSRHFKYHNTVGTVDHSETVFFDSVLKAKKTTPKMEFYNVKPIGGRFPFLILKASSKGPSNTSDWIEQVKTITSGQNTVVDVISVDYTNITTTKDGKNQFYMLPYTAEMFNEIINRKVFNLAGSNFLKYLKDYGGLNDLPSKATVVPLSDYKNFYDRRVFLHQMQSQYDVVELKKYNPDKPRDNQQTRLSRDSTDEMIVVLIKANAAGKIETEGVTSADTLKVSPAPEPMMERDSIGYTSGTILTADFSTTRTVTADDGVSKKKAAGLALTGADGKVLQVLIEPDSYSFLENNGKVQITFPMPYQDCKLKVLSPDEPVPPEPEARLDTADAPTDAVSELNIVLTKTGAAPKFSDIQGSPAKSDIELLASYGVVSGMSDGKFSPDLTMTRGMFVTALSGLTDIDMSEYRSSNFSDVPTKSWLRPYTEWAYKNGIATGHGDWEFKPDEFLTREQMAVILVAFLEKAGIPSKNADKMQQFSDGGQISDWAGDAVSTVCNMGIMRAVDGRFKPKDSMTRAEAASAFAALIRIIEKGGVDN